MNCLDFLFIHVDIMFALELHFYFCLFFCLQKITQGSDVDLSEKLKDLTIGTVIAHPVSFIYSWLHVLVFTIPIIMYILLPVLHVYYIVQRWKLIILFLTMSNHVIHQTWLNVYFEIIGTHSAVK